MKPFYKLLLRRFLTFLLAVGVVQAYSQCSNNNILWIDLTPAGPGQSASTTCMYAGEYVTVTVCEGALYSFSTCGEAGYDTQITLYSSAGVYLAYNDDGCSPESYVEWTATFSGQIRVLLDEYNCTSNEICTGLTVTQITSCGGGSTICDCNGTVHTEGVLSWIGDGFADDGTYAWEGQLVDFNCATWGYDCGDIPGAPSYDPYGVCFGFLPPDNGCSVESCSVTSGGLISDGCEGTSELVNFYVYFTGACEVYSIWVYTDLYGWEEVVLGGGYFSGDLIPIYLSLPATEYSYYFELTDFTTSNIYNYTTENCGGSTICDCAGTVHTDGVLEWIGDGFADDGTYVWEGQVVDFNCATWGYDCGDIPGAPSYDPYGVCFGFLPPDNGCSIESCFVTSGGLISDGCDGTSELVNFYVYYTGACEVYSIWVYTDLYGWEEVVLGGGYFSGDLIPLYLNLPATEYSYYFELTDFTTSGIYFYTTQNCGGSTICDCAGTVHTDGVLEWIGDGFADDGSYVWEGQPVDFNCATWGYDCGDIPGAPTNDPYGVCFGFLPPDNGCGLPTCNVTSVSLFSEGCVDDVSELVYFYVNFTGACEVYSMWSFTEEFGWYELVLSPGITSGDPIGIYLNLSSTEYNYYFQLTDGTTSDLYSYFSEDCAGGGCDNLTIDYIETECFEIGGTQYPSGDIYFNYTGDCLVDGLYIAVDGGAYEYLDLSGSGYMSGDAVGLYFTFESALYEIFYVLNDGSASESVFFTTANCTEGEVNTICDCAGVQHSSGVLTWLGDGFADDGTYQWEGQYVDFNCATWGYDCGDIVDAPIYDPYAVCYGNLPPANGCGPQDCYELEFDVLTDCFPNETSIAVFNENGEQVFYAPEGSYIEAYSLYTVYLCLPPGCYTYVIYDSFGDGLSAPECDSDGGYGVWDPSTGSYIITGPAAFGFSYELDFCTPFNNECSNLNLSISAEPCTPNGDTFSPGASYIFDYDGFCQVEALYLSENGGLFEYFDVSAEGWQSGDQGLWFYLLENAEYTMYYVLDDGTVSDLFTFSTGNCDSEVTICDCAGTVLSIGVLSWLGDGFADNGFYQWGDQYVDFNCATWGYDCGDIEGAPSLDPYGVCDGNLPPANGCGVEEILGCTDPEALNYNPNATVNDGSCIYNQLVGCTDEEACNFNPNAIVDDGTCEYLTCSGCTDPDATNYDSTATIDDGSCFYEEIEGCTDEEALNYNPIATIDDGSCVFSCIFPTITYDSYCITGDQENFYVLVDINALGNGAPYTVSNTYDDTQIQVNFMGNIELGPFENGSQVVIQVVSNTLDGCFITSPVITDDCSSGIITGCTDPLAVNYYADATVDDGSCEYDFLICDCDYNTFSPDARFNLGDGNADTGSGSNPNFNCEAWGYDCGDIAGSPTDDPYNVCGGNIADELIATATGCPLSITEGEVYEWNIFPNPSAGAISFINGGNHGTVNIDVYDVSGRVVISEQVNVPQRARIEKDWSFLSGGSYTIRISREGHAEYHKWVIQK